MNLFKLGVIFRCQSVFISSMKHMMSWASDLWCFRQATLWMWVKGYIVITRLVFSETSLFITDSYAQAENSIQGNQSKQWICLLAFEILRRWDQINPVTYLSFLLLTIFFFSSYTVRKATWNRETQKRHWMDVKVLLFQSPTRSIFYSIGLLIFLMHILVASVLSHFLSN